ncbi:MAG TPA: hypothetical protein VHP14_09540 [Anaerolineales bacterium]|nr:hypothetical protein [Anaerolineales bacterium]
MPKVPEQEDASSPDIGSVCVARQRGLLWMLGQLRAKLQLWILRMSGSILVQIIGAPIACSEGVKDSWREVAGWAAGQLKTRFGDEVSVQYYDLFDTSCPTIPPGSQLPLVLVNGEVLSSGGKISVPLIRKRVDALRAEASNNADSTLTVG